MKKLFSATILFITVQFTLSLQLHASPTTYCLKKHIEDAIQVNQKRRDKYAQLSDNRSIKISNSLIFLEKSTLVLNSLWGWDRRAKSYNLSKIPILCNDLLSMKKISSINTKYRPTQAFVPHSAKRFKQVRQKILKSLNMSKFLEVAKQAKRQIDRLPTDYYCMTRHIWETIFTLSSRAPRYIEQAQQAGLRSPQKLLQSLIKAQLYVIPTTIKLDTKAGPLQEEGVGIICHDIPHLNKFYP